MQAIDNKDVAEFYDKFWKDLDAKNQGGINSRHRYILYNLKKAGLKRNSKVLEIGCGLGMLTSFIASALSSSGSIRGVDISPESIEYAKRKYGKSNVTFAVDDMSDFRSQEKYDFIVFPDVLEHIPIEAHSNIFATIRKMVHKDSVILINIPNPMALEYFHVHYKKDLQIIDQPLHTDVFLKAIYNNGFYLESLKTYPVFFDEPDYQSMIVKPYEKFTSMKLKNKTAVMMKNIWLRIVNTLN